MAEKKSNYAHMGDKQKESPKGGHGGHSDNGSDGYQRNKDKPEAKARGMKTGEDDASRDNLELSPAGNTEKVLNSLQKEMQHGRDTRKEVVTASNEPRGDVEGKLKTNVDLALTSGDRKDKRCGGAKKPTETNNKASVFFGPNLGQSSKPTKKCKQKARRCEGAKQNVSIIGFKMGVGELDKECHLGKRLCVKTCSEEFVEDPSLS